MTYQVYDSFDGSTNSIVQVYAGSIKNSSTSYISKSLVWKKPRSAKFIHFLCVGGGGGGAGGATASSSGSSGGGSGSVISDLIPAIVLPDILYIIVGSGGSGGSSNTAGNVGGYTLVSFTNNNSTNPNYWASYSNHYINCSPGGGGNAGTTNPGSGGGFFYGLSTGYGALGIRSVLSGRNGFSSDLSNFFSASTWSNYTFFVGGGFQGGAANPASNGKSILLGGVYKDILGGIADTGNKGDDGLNAKLDLSIGFPRFRTDNQALFFTGGAGGAGSSSGVAGVGGDGGYGSGGGGGGSAPTLGNCAAGGNGGPGLVIITSIL